MDWSLGAVYLMHSSESQCKFLRQQTGRQNPACVLCSKFHWVQWDLLLRRCAWDCSLNTQLLFWALLKNINRKLLNEVKEARKGKIPYRSYRSNGKIPFVQECLGCQKESTGGATGVRVMGSWDILLWEAYKEPIGNIWLSHNCQKSCVRILMMTED